MGTEAWVRGCTSPPTVSVLEMSHSILIVTHLAAIQGRLNGLLGDSLLPPNFLDLFRAIFLILLSVFSTRGWGWSTVVERLSEKQKGF